MPQIAIQTASYLIAAVLLFLTLHLHLVPALFAGLLVFVIIDKKNRIIKQHSRSLRDQKGGGERR